MAYRKPGQRIVTAESFVLADNVEKRQFIYSKVDVQSGKFFGVTFKKKDGTTRRMTARTGVQKDLKGVGHGFDPKTRGLISVYDVNAASANREVKGDYRFINADTTEELTIGGDVYSFTEQSDGSHYVVRKPKVTA